MDIAYKLAEKENAESLGSCGYHDLGGALALPGSCILIPLP